MLLLNKELIFPFPAKVEFAVLAKPGLLKVRWIWKYIGVWNRKKLKKDTFSHASHIRKQKKSLWITISNDQLRKRYHPNFEIHELYRLFILNKTAKPVAKMCF